MLADMLSGTGVPQCSMCGGDDGDCIRCLLQVSMRCVEAAETDEGRVSVFAWAATFVLFALDRCGEMVALMDEYDLEEMLGHAAHGRAC